MGKSPMEGWVFGVTISALLFFQGLLFVAVPADSHLAVVILGAGMDAVFAAAYFWAYQERKRLITGRLRQVHDSLGMILELTKTQQAHWLGMLEGVVGLEAEDRLSMESLQHLLGALSTMEKPPLETPVARDASVEAMIDGIQTVLLLNHNLMADFDEVLAFYHRTYDKLRTMRTHNKLNHFRLNESVDFLGQMGQKTNAYSETLVLDVLTSFREITQFSQGISSEVMARMARLMDPGNAESLDAVNRESAEIRKTVNHYFDEMARANQLSEAALRENLAQMVRVQVMSQAIGEFSENIRMISLNLNIEAARGSSHGAGNGKAFQVLASKLSDFAVRARELSDQQQAVIGTASAVLSQTNEAQHRRVAALMAELRPIQGRLEPFSGIVNRTFNEFREVERSMAQLSSSIDLRLQAVIGKFQFQDLVRQEQEHLLAMFRFVRDRAEEGLGHLDTLSDEERMEAWNGLLHAFECLATTENELAFLREYRTKNPALNADGACSDVTAGSVELF